MVFLFILREFSVRWMAREGVRGESPLDTEALLLPKGMGGGTALRAGSASHALHIITLNAKTRSPDGQAEGRIEREGRLVFAEKGTGHFGNQPTLLRTHFGPHEGQLAIVEPCGGGDEGIAQAGTMDEMDIGSSSERTAVRQACLTEVGQGEDGAPLADACPIQMVLCDSHLGHALGREGDAIIAGKSIGEIKLIESHKD